MSFKDYFVGERAKALAQVLLTRRSDLIVEENRKDIGVDYMVYLRKDGSPGPRHFGIFMLATMTPVTLEQADLQLKPSMATFKQRGPFDFPVCVFYFTAKDDKGYFTWAFEPEVDKSGFPKLRSHNDASCRELNDKVLDEVVNVVNRWYDVLFAAITA